MQTRPRPKRLRKHNRKANAAQGQAGPEAGAAPDHPAPAGHREGHAPVDHAHHNAYSFEVNLWATKTQIKAAVEELFNVRVERCGRRRGSASSAAIASSRPAVELEEGHRQAARGRQDRVLLTVSASSRAERAPRSSGSLRSPRNRNEDGFMGIRQYKPTTPGRRQGSVSDFAEITDRKKKPEKSLLEPRQEEGRPQQPGHRLHALPWRRPQADVSHHRLQAAQGRRLGHGRVDRVRPEPLGPHRPAAVRGRREGVHPGPGRV